MADPQTLYLIYFDEAESALDESSIAGLQRLDDGLYLLRSGLTRSQVYHRIKRYTEPERLLVAPLEEHPKFKGMTAGALKWLRSS